MGSTNWLCLLSRNLRDVRWHFTTAIATAELHDVTQPFGSAVGWIERLVEGAQSLAPLGLHCYATFGERADAAVQCAGLGEPTCVQSAQGMRKFICCDGYTSCLTFNGLQLDVQTSSAQRRLSLPLYP